MVAGDANDAFTREIARFVGQLSSSDRSDAVTA
jgi:hypothetical protein